MRKLLILFFTIPVFANANQDSTWTETDTLEIFEDKVYVETFVYSNNKTIETYKAFLIPTTIKIARFKWTNIFKVKYSADRVDYHGERLAYFDNGYWKKEYYEKGNLTFVEYFNERNQELSVEEFNEGNNTRGPCGEPVRRYLVGERIKN